MPELAVPPSFVAEPPGAPPWPGVIVIHEGTGMSAQLLRLCERLAREGYLAIAPDLFHRSGGPEAADFSTLIGALRPEDLRADLAASRERLAGLGAARVGITGFCLGGSIAYRGALWGLDLAAAASFYGAHIPHELGEPRCPVLLVFGGDDEYIPTEAIEAVRAHHDDDVVVYPEAHHGFMRDGSATYDEAAATDAWGRLRAFFDEHLR